MPELPEVEVTCQGLIPHLVDREIIKIRYSGKKLRSPVELAHMHSALIGCHNKISKVSRRAKYILISFINGETLIIHLGMTGQLGIFPKGGAEATHDHLIFALDSDHVMRFNDTRRFGSVILLSRQDSLCMEDTFFCNTGVEPFSPECSAEYLKDRANGSTQAIKTFIMNSSIIAGVGNIYANESLFAASIHPSTKAGRLSLKRWKLLVDKIREILTWAINCGGSTISDFLNASGQQGYFQANFKVYGRNGVPCSKCQTLLKKTSINGRASYFCPSCQRR